MNKLVPYLLLFVIGIGLGYVFLTEEAYQPKQNYLAVDKPTVFVQENFMYSAQEMLGKDVVVIGKVKEVYKNKNNEMVLYIDVENIPVKVSCTLKNTDQQIKIPMKLGEIISVQGNFARLDERMELEKCQILKRE